MKTCCQCGETKPLEAFAKRKSARDGHCAHCKECHMDYHWRNHDENKKKLREYHDKNLDAHKEKMKTRYWSDPEAARAEKRDYYENNKEKVRESQHSYYERAKESILKSVKAWRKTENGKKCRRVVDEKRRAAGTLTTAEWNEILDQYGHKCLACGRTDVKLTIDHIVPVAKGGMTTKDNVQPLCYTCNRKKWKEIKDYRVR